MIRSCVFGDLQVLSYLLGDIQAQAYVDLSVRDEDGLGLISIAILGFGSESDRDVEREECVRLLISQGVDLSGDNGTFSLTLGLLLICLNWRHYSQPGGLLYITQHYYLPPH